MRAWKDSRICASVRPKIWHPAGFAAEPATAPAHSCGQGRDNSPGSEAKEREQLREQLLRRREVGLSSIGAVEYEPATARVISRRKFLFNGARSGSTRVSQTQQSRLPASTPSTQPTPTGPSSDTVFTRADGGICRPSIGRHQPRFLKHASAFMPAGASRFPQRSLRATRGDPADAQRRGGSEVRSASAREGIRARLPAIGGAVMASASRIDSTCSLEKITIPYCRR